MAKFIVTVTFEMDKTDSDEADEMVSAILDAGLSCKDKSTKLVKVRIEKKENS